MGIQKQQAKDHRAALRVVGAALLSCVAIALFTNTANSQSSKNETYWQIHLQYTQEALTLVDAAPIAIQRKSLTQPGLTGAATTLSATIDWLDGSGLAVATSEILIPFGTRVAPIPGAACEAFIPDAASIVLRVLGPSPAKQATSIRIRNQSTKAAANDRDLVPAPFQTAAIDLVIPPSPVSSAKAGPIAMEKILDTGPDSNRLVIVVMGDGYRDVDLQAGAFDQDADALVTAFLGRAPWDVYLGATNVYRIDLDSNESGSDNETNSNGPLKDTYLNSAFWSFGIERLLTIDGTGSSRAITAANDMVGAGVWDYIFVLVNSDKYGGSGGAIGVSSVHPSATEVILHEFGHSFAGLADEYENPIPGQGIQDPEPNVDVDSQESLLKWRHWVEPGTPLPTPETSQYNSIVGAFEGARYNSTGIFRPWMSCLMRDLGQQFCPVCSEEHALSFFDHVTLTDSASHTPGSLISVPSQGLTISVDPITIANLTYTWSLNGTPIAGETASSLTLLPAAVPSGSNSLRIDISHPTALIRKTTIDESITWTVEATQTTTNDECVNAIPVFLDQPYDGSSLGSTGNLAVCTNNDKRDVWHTFTAQSDGTARISTCLGVDFDTTIAVYDQCGGTLLACNNDFCGTASEVEVPVTSGQTLLIRIAGNGGQRGAYTLLVENLQDPAPTICRDGDVNGDCLLTPADALLIFQAFTQEVTLTLEQQYHADIRNPQDPPVVTPTDAKCIFEYFLEDPSSCLDVFPQDCSCTAQGN